MPSRESNRDKHWKSKSPADLYQVAPDMVINLEGRRRSKNVQMGLDSDVVRQANRVKYGLEKAAYEANRLIGNVPQNSLAKSARNYIENLRSYKGSKTGSGSTTVAAAAPTPKPSVTTKAASTGGAKITGKGGSIRGLPITDDLRRILKYAADKAGIDRVHIVSGGQPSRAATIAAGGRYEPAKYKIVNGKRKKVSNAKWFDASGKQVGTGSTRHEVGEGATNPIGSADVDLYKNGEKVTFSDWDTFAKFTAAAREAGATGFGAGDGYMGDGRIHVGGGRETSWAEYKGKLATSMVQGVKDLQTSLNDLGANIAVDGSYGPATQAAVDKYRPQLAAYGGEAPEVQIASVNPTGNIPEATAGLWDKATSGAVAPGELSEAAKQSLDVASYGAIPDNLPPGVARPNADSMQDRLRALYQANPTPENYNKLQEAMSRHAAQIGGTHEISIPGELAPGGGKLSPEVLAKLQASKNILGKAMSGPAQPSGQVMLDFEKLNTPPKAPAPGVDQSSRYDLMPGNPSGPPRQTGNVPALGPEGVDDPSAKYRFDRYVQDPTVADKQPYPTGSFAERRPESNYGNRVLRDPTVADFGARTPIDPDDAAPSATPGVDFGSKSKLPLHARDPFHGILRTAKEQILDPSKVGNFGGRILGDPQRRAVPSSLPIDDARSRPGPDEWDELPKVNFGSEAPFRSGTRRVSITPDQDIANTDRNAAQRLADMMHRGTMSPPAAAAAPKGDGESGFASSGPFKPASSNNWIKRNLGSGNRDAMDQVQNAMTHIAGLSPQEAFEKYKEVRSRPPRPKAEPESTWSKIGNAIPGLGAAQDLAQSAIDYFSSPGSSPASSIYSGDYRQPTYSAQADRAPQPALTANYYDFLKGGGTSAEFMKMHAGGKAALSIPLQTLTNQFGKKIPFAGPLRGQSSGVTIGGGVAPREPTRRITGTVFSANRGSTSSGGGRASGRSVSVGDRSSRSDKGNLSRKSSSASKKTAGGYSSPSKRSGKRRGVSGN